MIRLIPTGYKKIFFDPLVVLSFPRSDSDVIFQTTFWKRLSYTPWSPFYDVIAGAFARLRRQSIQKLDLQPRDRVLLVGAGTGLDLDHLPTGISITAVDLTPAMIAHLKSRARRLKIPVDAKVMNAQALSFPDGSFDAVVLHLIVAVVPDPVACVREAARVLRPGGSAVILDKFIPDDERAPLLMRLMNPIASCFATEMTQTRADSRGLGPAHHLRRTGSHAGLHPHHLA